MYFSTVHNRFGHDTAALVRIWRTTGNPSAPLAAIWVTPAQAATLNAADTRAEGGLRPCA